MAPRKRARAPERARTRHDNPKVSRGVHVLRQKVSSHVGGSSLTITSVQGRIGLTMKVPFIVE